MRYLVPSAILLGSALVVSAAPPRDAALSRAFENNVLVTDKKTYVHVFWNAQDVKSSFAGPGKRLAVARAALQLALEKVPATAKADLLKIDIVTVAERDNYGQPRWDTLTRVAHLEILRGKALARAKRDEPLSEGELASLFQEIKIV